MFDLSCFIILSWCVASLGAQYSSDSVYLCNLQFPVTNRQKKMRWNLCSIISAWVQSHGSPYHDLREVPFLLHVIFFFFLRFWTKEKTYDQKQKHLTNCNKKFYIFFNAVPLDFLMECSCPQSETGIDFTRRTYVYPFQ